ncbi:MAG: hypothetical protein WC483_03905 [Candidatus Paceibacterota bacterium]
MYEPHSYVISASCTNCGWHGRQVIPKGVSVSQATCPECGCQAIIIDRQANRFEENFHKT